MDPAHGRAHGDRPSRGTGGAALAAADKRFQRLLEKTTDGILVLGREGAIRYANPAAEELFGKAAGALLGTTFGFPVVTGEVVEVEVLHRGEPQPVEMRVMETEWEGGPALLVVLHDISERRRLEAERRAAQQHLEEMRQLRERDGFKTQFINTSAHELGTPLTTIRLQLGLLQDAHGSQLPAEAQRSVAILARNVNRLSQLIHDMLQVARIQAGKVQLQVQEVDLAHLAAEALDSFREATRVARVTLDLEGAERLPVRADPLRMAQVFDNLLDNALKFTPPGGRIAVHLRPEGERAVVTVRDTGRGLSPEDLPKLFQPYSQVPDPTGGQRRGTGLGLYICRGIVEAHGGTITASSAGRGLGSTFRFELPLE